MSSRLEGSSTMEIDILEAVPSRDVFFGRLCTKEPCPFCFLLCFSAGWRNAGWRNAHLAGGSTFHICVVVLCFVLLLISHAIWPQMSMRFYFKLLLHMCLGAWSPIPEKKATGTAWCRERCPHRTEALVATGRWWREVDQPATDETPRPLPYNQISKQREQRRSRWTTNQHHRTLACFRSEGKLLNLCGKRYQNCPAGFNRRTNSIDPFSQRPSSNWEF